MRTLTGLACGLILACTADPATLDEPTHAVVANGLVYVSDGYSHARIAAFDAAGRFRFDWGSKGFGRSQFNTPHALATLADGSLLVADRDNARIQRFSPDGAFIAEWFGPEIGRPWAIAVTSDDRIFAVDGGDQDPDAPRSGIAELDTAGRVLCRWSRFGDGPDELDWGHMIAVTDDGAVIVADLNNRRLVRFDEVTPCGWEADPGWPAADLGEAFEPLGVAAREGRIYVSEASPGRPIRVLDATTGAELDTLGAELFQRPHGLFVDATGLWVTDQAENRVTRLSLDGEVELVLGADP